jgi:hypothetical protein
MRLSDEGLTPPTIRKKGFKESSKRKVLEGQINTDRADDKMYLGRPLKEEWGCLFDTKEDS